jgi:glutamate/aspartate transport system substrate-binding protein
MIDWIEFNGSFGNRGVKMLRFVSLFFAIFVSVATASAQTGIPSDSRLKTIADKKIIRIAYRNDATPFAFANDKGEPAGYSLDLCQLVTKSIAQQYGLEDLKIEWVPVTVQTRFSAISSGKADMECGSSTVTLGRMKDVDFSNVIFVESTGVVVTRASNIQSFAGMAGKKIVVIAGTTNERAVAEQNRQHNLNLTLVAVQDLGEAVAALQAGKVDGFASDKLLLIGAKMKNADAFVMLPDDLSIEPYAIALPRGDWALRLAVNTGLAQIYRSGQIAEVFRRWFDQIGLRPSVLMGAAFILGGLPD